MARSARPRPARRVAKLIGSAAAILLVGWVIAVPGPITRLLPGPTGAGNATRLHNGWTISPAGAPEITGTMLLGSALSPDGKLLAMVSAGFDQHQLNLVDTQTGIIRYQVPLLSAWNGVVWAPDGKTLYVSSGAAQSLNVLRQNADGSFSDSGSLVLDALPPNERVYFSGLAISPRQDLLYVANCAGDSIYALHLPDGAIAAREQLPSGARPYCVRFGPDGLVYVCEWGVGRVVALDPLTLASVHYRSTGGHPNDIAFSNDGRRMFVSCANADDVESFDVRTGNLVDQVRTTHTPGAPAGATPCALAMHPNGRLLFVADSDGNDVAEVGLGARGAMRLLGFIPTGWYPTAVAVSADGRRLFVGSGKGRGTGPTLSAPVQPGDEKQPKFTRVTGLLHGMISTLPTPRLTQLAAYTRQVLSNSPYNDDDLPLHPAASPARGANPIPSRVGDPSPLRHVLYIIKENRTYDQVLGDLGEGNSDPDLTLFGEGVTPNHHALARQFTLLDNLYCNGEVSADGHAWSDGALATDYTQRAWMTGYSSHGAPPPTESLITPPAGFIWDECARKGIGYRSYGEYAYATPTARQSVPLRGQEGLSGLRGHTSLRWLQAMRSGARDTEKADIFINDLHAYEQYGGLPRFIVMSLGEDHTRGTGSGQISPRASVASNDAALGKIVAACAASRYWKNMAIFVIEDDSQNGPDHVDAHRTCGFVISPYVRRGIIDSNFYTTASFLRTMELILGLPPMSQYDAAATPLYASFTSKPDFTGYVTLPSRIDLNAVNSPKTAGADRMRSIDFSGYDHLTVDDEDALNRALWYSIKGENTPYPGIVSRIPVRPLPAGAKDPDGDGDDR